MCIEAADIIKRTCDIIPVLSRSGEGGRHCFKIPLINCAQFCKAAIFFYLTKPDHLKSIVTPLKWE
jgi:hypothetical protein